MLRTVGAFWGLTGIIGLLGGAIYRLTPVALEAFARELTWYHWLLAVVNVVFMAYSEGFHGFQRKFSPRVAARAKYLKAQGNLTLTIFAPLFCMGYFRAVVRVKVVAYLLTIGIVLLIFLVHQTPQPWRGIIDIGVVVGLGWGIVTLCIYSAHAFRTEDFTYSPEVAE